MDRHHKPVVHKNVGNPDHLHGYPESSYVAEVLGIPDHVISVPGLIKNKRNSFLDTSNRGVQISVCLVLVCIINTIILIIIIILVVFSLLLFCRRCYCYHYYYFC